MPPGEHPFDALEDAIREGGPAAALECLVAQLKAERRLPQLFESLLMKKRYDLGLPVEGSDSLRDLPEELQQTVEDYYVATCRDVGALFLEQGDIAGAWPYFRAIDEPEAVAEALERWTPPESDDEEPASDRDTIIDIAFQQGVHPRRGFELILSEHGTCRAVSVFEHQFPHAGAVKEQCAAMLVRRLHGELVEGIRADVERREGACPEATDVGALIDNRKWLFDDRGYHVDVSHLQSVVRAALILRGREELNLAIELCDYGRHLARDFQGAEQPPFEDYYNDHRIFLRALVGEGVDGAVRYFSGKAERGGPDEDGRHFAGEVVVRLLHGLGRHSDAVEAYLKYLEDAPAPLGLSPPLLELCERAGDFEALLRWSRRRQDPLQFTVGLVKKADRGSSSTEEPA